MHAISGIRTQDLSVGASEVSQWSDPAGLVERRLPQVHALDRVATVIGLPWV
jgi:hypothetical protein